MHSLKAFIYGTMRLGDLSAVEARDYLVYILKAGIRQFHSSYEYECFDIFVAALRQACQICDIDPQTLQHTVKLAAPHFDEMDIAETDIYSRLDIYRDKLNVDKIACVQWMARIDLKREALRLALLEEQAVKLAKIVGGLKSNGAIHHFGCFPYTLEFAKRAIETEVFDSMIDYLNPFETMPVSYRDAMIKNNMTFAALRPFAAGKAFAEGYSLKALLENVFEFQPDMKFIAGTLRIDHFDEITAVLNDMSSPQL